jgi:hypothetical protein
MKKIIDIFLQETAPILDIPGIQSAFAFQPLSLTTLSTMSPQNRGGNALGLSSPSSSPSGPLTILNLNFAWSHSTHDTAIHSATERFIARAEAAAKEMGLWHRFKYMNYASLDQDVFAGYGVENVQRLRSVQAKYDPENVFGRLQPGYFKL